MDGDQKILLKERLLTKEESDLLLSKLPRVARLVHEGRTLSIDQQMLVGEMGELLTLVGRMAQERISTTDYQWISECVDVFIQCFFMATRLDHRYFFRMLMRKLDWISDIYDHDIQEVGEHETDMESDK